jgi:tetratricopeptide (TPR) repeat protein
MMRRGLSPVAVFLLLLVLVGARTPASAAPPAVQPLAAPIPDLVGLLEFVETPLDKPPVLIPSVKLPAAPDPLVAPPPVAISLPEKPVAVVPPSRALACAGTWLGVASESLECGIARYREGRYDEAARSFEQAIRLGGDRPDVVRTARYWLGESYWKLDRIELADRTFARVAQGPGRDGLELWAQASSGWTALRLGDSARARDTFARLLAARPPFPLDGYGRFGLGLSLYALSRYEEAQRAWSDATSQRLPDPVIRDSVFWSGETHARLAQHDRAAAELGRFVTLGSHPLQSTAMMRLGWALLAAGKYPEAVARLREAPRLPRDRNAPDEQDWYDAGLALALVGAGDLDGARTAARPLAQRKSKLSTAVHLKLFEALVVARRGPEADALAQELLAGTLEAEARAWVLLLKGEASRAGGNLDDARTQYDLARTTAPGKETARHATFRLAQANYDFREFKQAAQESGQVAIAATSSDLRDAALVLQAEAAYAAGDYAGAEAAYGRVLADAPQHPQAALLRLSAAWAALRRGQGDEARRRFLEFAAQNPTDPRRPEALLLASELALKAGDTEAGRRIIDQVIAEYGSHPHTQFARLNRGILLARTGNLGGAQREISDWLSRSPFPPLVGRARAALGVVQLAAGRPADAAREFAAARKEGEGAFAALGLGTTALSQGRLDDAERDLKEASATGTTAVAATADYGLAVAALQRGNAAGFKNVAAGALNAAPNGPMAPRLLYVLTGLSVEEKDWPGALAAARRLATQFKDSDLADDALERVVEGAAQAKAWPVVSEAYQLLRQQYPRSPFVDASRVAFAEAELESGRADVARRELEPLVAQRPPAEVGPALVILARAREAGGDRTGALDAYSRAAQGGAPGLGDAAVQQARLLLDEKKPDEARAVLEPLMKASDPTAVAQAAQVLGSTYQGEGNHQAAAEYFLTAAYLAPESPAGRQAMLEAAKSFAALKQPDSAAIVYRKLLAQAGLPADVADAARQGLAALGRN